MKIVDTLQIRKGDMLFCHQDLAQIDTAAFGADAREFKPKRFVGNPDLKKKVTKLTHTKWIQTPDSL